MMTGMVNDMGHRGRVVVEVGAPSQHILVIMPKGYERLGVVSVGSGDPGVLAKITASGEYVQLDARGTTPLDRRKVEAAIEAAGPRSVGRPRFSYEKREVASISMEPSLLQFARELGGGSLSAGVALVLREKRDDPTYVHSIHDSKRVKFVPNAWRKTPAGDDLMFDATVDGDPRECVISREALEDHFGASNGSEGELKRAFVSGINRIQALAIKKLTNEAGDPILRTEDFSRP